MNSKEIPRNCSLPLYHVEEVSFEEARSLLEQINPAFPRQWGALGSALSDRSLEALNQGCMPKEPC
jgi:hypothetical protein